MAKYPPITVTLHIPKGLTPEIMAQRMSRAISDYVNSNMVLKGENKGAQGVV